MRNDYFISMNPTQFTYFTVAGGLYALVCSTLLVYYAGEVTKLGGVYIPERLRSGLALTSAAFLASLGGASLVDDSGETYYIVYNAAFVVLALVYTACNPSLILWVFYAMHISYAVALTAVGEDDPGFRIMSVIHSNMTIALSLVWIGWDWKTHCDMVRAGATGFHYVDMGGPVKYVAPENKEIIEEDKGEVLVSCS